MIPLRIEVSNFRAISHADIDLSAVSLAAIAGKNGAGKSSAFTLAPRFALFGDVVKGVSLDDLVRKGASEMSVLFEFEHHGSVYRTIRTRSTKGKGKSTLELQQLVNGQWENRSAEKIIDTEAVIRELLNLDDETFTASSMILQGQANAFTGATPGKRKEILQQILGLNVYDQLQERAQQRAGSLHIEIEKSKDKLLALSDRLAEKPAKEVEFLRTVEQSTQNDLLITTNESDIRKFEEQIRSLQMKTEKASELAKQSEAIDQEIATLNIEKGGHAAKLERAGKILERETDILAKSIEHDELKQQIAVLEARFPERERLQREQIQLISDLDAVMFELNPLAGRIASLETILASRELLYQKSMEYAEAYAQLQIHEQKAEQWNIAEAEYTDLRAKHQVEMQRILLLERTLETEIKNLITKTAMFEDANCIDVVQAACRFLADAQSAKKLVVEKQSELGSINHTYAIQLEVEIAAILERQQLIGYDNDAHRECKVEVDSLNTFAEQYAQFSGKEELLQTLQEQKASLEQRKLNIEGKQRQIATDLEKVNQELDKCPVLKERLGKLQQWVTLKDELAAAREAKQNAEERIAAIDAEILAKNNRKAELELQRSAILLETLELDKLQANLVALQSQLRNYREQQTTLATLIGGIKAQLAALEKDQEDRDRLAAEMEPKSKRWARYQTLIKAFGRDGIPALIIENAVPQLERIANEILGQMSKGKHYVRFETQKELKSRDGVVETLDIMIGDWMAERPYETFSGGEQLRIDYAIRFALAELLAQRAGSKVEFLIVDEGLSSQDQEHRILVLESIMQVKNRFKKVIFITHIEEAKSYFDQVIMLDRDDEGNLSINIA